MDRGCLRRNKLRSLLIWIVFNIPLGPFAPKVFEWSIRHKGKKEE
nr:MAG TPA_asm: hypothetical protein [Caudoviricetes sp.]